ncbi:MAG TPA: hypothetical protein VMB21_00695 [Candidatus Limnocylindria bacterium]|jgi:hypothetical protein|nr:hypothetical protein [Candidatus Limnocylindria bacterium]
MSDPKPQFDTFQAAYCAAHRCTPEQFGWVVFRRCLHRHALPVAAFMRLWDPSFFQSDFEVITAIGRSATQEELQVLIDEFENRRVVERDLLHATLRIRLSNFRLTETFLELVPLLKPAPAAAAPETEAKATPVPSREAADSLTLALRRLKRLHAAVVVGTPLPEAAAEAGMALEEIGPLIERHKAGRPELVWLGEYLVQLGKLAELRDENERLMRLTADLTRKLIQPAAEK